jgi:hypothetical protein
MYYEILICSAVVLNIPAILKDGKILIQNVPVENLEVEMTPEFLLVSRYSSLSG